MRTIIKILSGNFLKLIGFGFTLAVPLTWYFMNRWLLDFACGIRIDWRVFPLSGLLVTMIVLISMSFQVIRSQSQTRSAH